MSCVIVHARFELVEKGKAALRLSWLRRGKLIQIELVENGKAESSDVELCRQ